MARTAILLLGPAGDPTRERALALALAALGDRFEVSNVLHMGEHAGLAAALGLVERAGEATLVVPALGSVAASLEELLALLDWLAAAGAHLYAVDVELDSGTPAGRRAVEVLRALARWERGAAAQARAPRGRPGLASSTPELASQIAALRERGMSLRAIAEQLNRDGVPTPRGGVLWRPSSVQAALGYRRPRPAPPLPPPPARPGAGAPPRPGRPGPRREPPFGVSEPPPGGDEPPPGDPPRARRARPPRPPGARGRGRA